MPYNREGHGETHEPVTDNFLIRDLGFTQKSLQFSV